ncbi:multidrug resistance protein A [Alsobacter metallidurans]|uniref:Multidrug resistance protein A n=1 Tax=Alsobacter metallidurans TaxID=340221 RepID=A0A917I6E6_9HYPH|nr:HlyD family secretion protein [Alsobacter metallidurans]GGH17787.1 multidrug resistance protein A [Alsobacter metallidurans]
MTQQAPSPSATATQDVAQGAELSDASAAAPQAQAAPPPRKRRGLRFALFFIIPAIAAVGGGYAYLHGGRFITTDNAYVGAQKVLVTPEVSGKVARILVEEGQRLSPGDELFEIDQTSYRIAVQEAQAHLGKVSTDFDTLKASAKSLESQLQLARQTLQLRQADYGRKQDLLASRAGSRAELENSEITVAAARSQVEMLQQQQATALSQLNGDPNLPIEGFAPWMEAKAALDRAQRNLSLTVLRAPIAGVATQVSSIQMGRYLDSGAPVFSIVADDKPWVDANPKETDLTYVQAGQAAEITVDAYPDRVWRGHVGSISPGTGAQFAILPPQNASGNWVKVVQRVPVRIEFDAGQDVAALRAGMSTNVSIDTKRQRSLAGLLGLSGAVASPKSASAN